MATDTQSDKWGAFSLVGVSAQLALGAKGTVYALRNMNNGDTYLFLLADLGFGVSLGARVNQAVRIVAKSLLSNKYIIDPGSYTRITANRSFSAGDLNLARGAEATIGVAATIVGCSATTVSAWPFFQGAPTGGEVNNDYFSGSVIYSTNDFGLSVSAAYQFTGMWFKLWSFGAFNAPA